MALETQCDNVLNHLHLYRRQGVKYEFIYDRLIWINCEKGNETHHWKDTVMAILEIDGFIETGAARRDANNVDAYFITKKGIAFIATDSYVNRAERWELDRKIKEQEYKLGSIELWAKRKTFYIALAALIFSILSLAVTYKQYKLDSDNATKAHKSKTEIPKVLKK